MESLPDLTKEDLESLGKPIGQAPGQTSVKPRLGGQSGLSQELVDRLVALKRLGYSYRQIQTYFIEKIDDVYSLETI
jgi:hypothetical protein